MLIFQKIRHGASPIGKHTLNSITTDMFASTIDKRNGLVLVSIRRKESWAMGFESVIITYNVSGREN